VRTFGRVVMAIPIAEAAKLQRFVDDVQIWAGLLASAPACEMPDLVSSLATRAPEKLGPVATRALSGLLAQIVCRVETASSGNHDSADVARRVSTLFAAPPDRIRELFIVYVSDAALRAAARASLVTLPEPRVRMALEYMRAHYRDRLLSLSDTAAAVGMSRWHLDRLLRLETGLCFVGHVRELRLNAAMTLLRESTRSVKEVAFLAGFGSVRSFNRQFRFRHLLSPKQWASPLGAGIRAHPPASLQIYGSSTQDSASRRRKCG
jgi:AraC-like DNA-binding protein